MAGTDWGRLAAYASERMKALKIHTHAELARRSGLSAPTVRAVLMAKPRGKTLSADTLGNLDDALNWELGSAAAILAGGEPVPADPVEGDVSSLDELGQMERRLSQQIAEVRQSVDAVGDTLHTQMRALVESMQEALHRLAEAGGRSVPP